jgi:hypothetical protein
MSTSDFVAFVDWLHAHCNSSTTGRRSPMARSNGMGMGTVTVNRVNLLETVKANRQEHRKEFESACVGYRKEAIKHLEEMLDEAKQGKRIRRAIGLVEPMDQTKDYDRIIKMLEMSVDEDIELTQSEFAQYVMDDWAWKGQFISSVSTYNIKSDS